MYILIREQQHSVQEALIFELGRLNVKVKTDFIVTAIEKKTTVSS